MQIVQIISEHKRKLKHKPVKKGHKRVMAIVKDDPKGPERTAHIDVPKE
jgi:hypothetical protein